MCVRVYTRVYLHICVYIHPSHAKLLPLYIAHIHNLNLNFGEQKSNIY